MNVANLEDSAYLLIKSLYYNIRKDLCTNNYDIETLESKRFKNIIFREHYRQANGDLKESENYFNDFFSKNEKKLNKINIFWNFSNAYTKDFFQKRGLE